MTENKHKTAKALRNLLIKLVAIAAVVWLLLRFVLGVFVVHTNDMYPSVRDGDLLITWKLTGYAYGDIVAYRCQDETRFGRIVGLPGDVIDLDGQGGYTVNGAEPYEAAYPETYAAAGSEVVFPYTVDEDELFVLHDLRTSSGDSRTYGGVRKADAEGSVVLLLRRRGW